jgi:hypothetical protein
MPLLSKVLDEHLLDLTLAGVPGMFEGVAYGSHCDDEGRVVRALYDILVQLNNLLNSSNYKNLLVWQFKVIVVSGGLLGSALCPVISSGSPTVFGAIVFNSGEKEFWQCKGIQFAACASQIFPL